MIPYHGLDINPNVAAVKVLQGRHAFVSHAHPEQLEIAQEISRSWALDNGAFSAWGRGDKAPDWEKYYKWVEHQSRFPGYDFAVVPDVVDGSEEQNDLLLEEWPLGKVKGAPVYHLHESLERIDRLIAAGWVRICLGSSGAFATPGTPGWWRRIEEIMPRLCDADGFPKVKIHGLRMMDPSLRRIPFASVDSTSVGRNIAYEKNWTGSYSPPTRAWRAVIMAERLEQQPCVSRWVARNDPQRVLEGFDVHDDLPGMRVG